MGEKMRYIGELRILWANTAVQWYIGVVLRHFGCSYPSIFISNCVIAQKLKVHGYCQISKKERENLCRCRPLRFQLRKPQKPTQFCTGGATIRSFYAMNSIFGLEATIDVARGYCVVLKIERDQNSQIILNRCSSS